MKKESSEQQQRALRKFVRLHKPTPAMSGASGARKSTPVVPVGRRTTRSEAAKIRAEKDLHGKVSPAIKFDSKHCEDTSSSESTDSQSEQQKPITNVTSTKTNDNQCETIPQQETVEEKSAKKPRKKRISRALFRHDTIDYIKPKKQELLQKTFSLGFKKLVNKSKEIYTKNDDLPNEENIEAADKNNEETEIKDNTIKVACPMKSPQITSATNEEKQINISSSNTIKQSKSMQHILDMPSLDSPNSQDLCTTQTASLNKVNPENNNTRLENHKNTKSKKNETQKQPEERAVPKNTILNDKLSTTTVPRNVCHIQTNSSQKLQYPFYGIIPNKRNTVTSEEQLKSQETIEDQIPKYKITIVNNPTRVKTNSNTTNPHQYLVPREVSQFKIPPHPKPKQQVIENQIKLPQYPENQMHAMSQIPYPYFHPNYGHPYNLYPYFNPGYPQNFAPQQRQIWNPHILNQQRTDRQQSNNIPTKEGLLNQEKRFSPENTVVRQEDLQQKKQVRFISQNTIENLRQRKPYLPPPVVLRNLEELQRNANQETLSKQEKRVKFSPDVKHQENMSQAVSNQRFVPENTLTRQENQEKRVRFSPENTVVRQENMRPRNTAQEAALSKKMSPDIIAVYQENLRQINTHLTPKESMMHQEKLSLDKSTIHLQRSTTLEPNQETAINSQTVNNLNHEIPIIHQQNIRHINKNETQINRQSNCTIVQEQSNHQTQQLPSENLPKIQQELNSKTAVANINYSKPSSHQNINQQVVRNNNQRSFVSQMPFVQNISHRYQTNNQEQKDLQIHKEKHCIGSQQNINTTTQKLNVDNSTQSRENSVQGQKRSGSPIEHKKYHKRVHFDSNLNDKINLLTPINYSKPDNAEVPIINVIKMPNTSTSQTGTVVETQKKLECPTQTKESVIVSPNNRRPIPETSEQRVIVLQTNDNLHSDHHNLHNQNKNNILFMRDKKSTPAENNNKIIQTTCSVIKKVCTENKNQHTIENILSNKCSAQVKTNNEVNNNKNEKIQILNIETIGLKDSRYNILIPEENKTPKTVIASLQKALKHSENTTGQKIKSFECETIQNNPTPSRILTRRKTLQHIDLTHDTDQEKNTNSLNLQQQLHSDSISLNETHTMVVSPNRLTHTQTDYSNMETRANTQEMTVGKNTDQKSVVVSDRPMPKLIKVPEEYLNKRSKLETSDKTSERTENSRIAETSDNRSSTIEPRVNNYASKNVVPFLKPAHSNIVNKTVEPSTLLPLNLSLKYDALTNEPDKESDQNKRQSIIVNNKSGTHTPLDLTTLSFVKSEEEYKGYLKLLKDKNATGPYLFYKFVTSVRKRNNEPIFDLITFFSLLKQGKLVEYKNLYNQWNNN